MLFLRFWTRVFVLSRRFPVKEADLIALSTLLNSAIIFKGKIRPSGGV